MTKLIAGTILVFMIIIHSGCSNTNRSKRKYYQKHTLDTKDRNDRLLKDMGSNPTKSKKKKKKNKYK